MNKTKYLTFTAENTKKIANLAKLDIDYKEEIYLTKQFNETLKVVNRLNQLPTSGFIATSQVTGLKNIFREDKIDKDRILTQNEALSNAKRTYNGFFVVKAIFNDK